MSGVEYRVGLNLFNRGPPDRGIQFLLHNGFIRTQDSLAPAVAHLLHSRSGLSRQRISEYLCQPDKQFNILVLHHFMQQLNFRYMTIDDGLRRVCRRLKLRQDVEPACFLTSFATHYVSQNQEDGGEAEPMLSEGQATIIAKHILVLNRSWHSAIASHEKRITLPEFLEHLIHQLGYEFPHDEYLRQIYDRTVEQEIRSGDDHTDRVQEIERCFTPSPDNRRPLLFTSANLDRRLVLQQSVRWHEQTDWKTDPQPFRHNKEVFLFNDLLVMTERGAQVDGRTKYQFCRMLLLTALDARKVCSTGSTAAATFGIQVVRQRDNKVLLLMSSRCERDRDRIFDHLKESIIETEMTDAAMSLN